MHPYKTIQKRGEVVILQQDFHTSISNCFTVLPNKISSSWTLFPFFFSWGTIIVLVGTTPPASRMPWGVWGIDLPSQVDQTLAERVSEHHQARKCTKSRLENEWFFSSLKNHGGLVGVTYIFFPFRQFFFKRTYC